MPVTVVQILQSADYAEQVRRGAQLLGDGKVIVLPTETVYGAAALLSHPGGPARLREVRKASPAAGALTPHLADRDQAEQFLGRTSGLARRTMSRLWPGPVALQFEVDADRRREAAGRMQAAEADIYDGAWITLRCPDHAVFTDLAIAAGGPLAVVMAGKSRDAGAAQLAVELDGKADLIFDAGPPRFSKPSTLVKVGGDGFQIVRSGVYDERTIRRLMKTTILFVCSGNTCRSAMAEAIARKVLSSRLGVDPSGLEKRGIEVMSAGAFAMAGARATPEAAEAVKTLGADLSRHRSRPLSVELINQADLIYVMGHGHGSAVTAMMPSAEGKVHLLDPEKEIDDPIGGDARLYNELAGELWKLIDQRLGEQETLVAGG